jgi:hypothetical protein
MSFGKSQSGFSHTSIILILIVVVTIAGAGWFVIKNSDKKKADTQSQATKTITSFDECVAAGNPVMELFPEQCATNGKTFTKPTAKTQDETANWLLYTPPGS